MSKVTKSIINEYFEKKGITGSFNYDLILGSIKQNELANHLMNYSEIAKCSMLLDKLNSQVRDYDELKNVSSSESIVLNVRTAYGANEPFPAVPDFLEQAIPNIKQKALEFFKSTNLEVRDFHHWNDIDFCEASIVENNPNYWELKNFKAEEIFQPAENNKIIEGLKKHISDEMLNRTDFKNKEEIFYEIEAILDDFCSNNESLSRFLDAGVININRKTSELIIETINEVQNTIKYYEYMPNLIEDQILATQGSRDKIVDLFDKYRDYVVSEEIKVLDVNLEKSKFEFKANNKRIITFDIDPTFEVKEGGGQFKIPEIKVKISGKNYFPESHRNIMINGKKLEDMKLLAPNMFLVDRLKIIKELQDFSKLSNSIKNIEHEKVKLISVIDYRNPNKVALDISLNTYSGLNDKNQYIEKHDVFVFDHEKEVEYKADSFKILNNDLKHTTGKELYEILGNDNLIMDLMDLMEGKVLIKDENQIKNNESIKDITNQISKCRSDLLIKIDKEDIKVRTKNIKNEQTDIS